VQPNPLAPLARRLVTKVLMVGTRLGNITLFTVIQLTIDASEARASGVSKLNRSPVAFQ
jgi:hypothetical protein